MRSRIFALSVVIVSLMSFPTGEMACAWGQEQAGRRSADRLDRLRQRLESTPGPIVTAIASRSVGLRLLCLKSSSMVVCNQAA